MASGRSRHHYGDADQQVADAMKQVKKAMKQVKEATRGMGKMHVSDTEYHPPPAGFKAPPTKPQYNIDGSQITIDKAGVLGKNTHINIHNSKNIQIGSNNVMIVNQTSEKGRGRRHRRRRGSSSSSSDDDRGAGVKGSNPVLTQDYNDILYSERLVGDQDVRTGSKFMGKSWRRIGRALSLSDPDLEQIHIDYFHTEGIQGVGYHVIQTWRQKAGRQATLGTLTGAICKCYPPSDVLKHFTP